MVKRIGESGNIFFTLFGAVALVGVIGVATSNLMRGPVGTVMKLNQQAKAESQLQIARKMAALEAAQQATNDCEPDTYLEPLPPDVAGACATLGLTGGGCLPSTVGASQNDPWGTRVGYCAWDHGPTIGTCDPNLLDGTNAATETVIAVISAGPDRTFQSTCGNDPAYVTKGGDDLVMEWTYDDAIQGAGGLWALKSSDPDTAEILNNKNIEVGGNASFQSGAQFARDVSFGAGSYLDLSAGSLLNLPDHNELIVCNAANNEALRVDSSVGLVLQICDDGVGWVDIGGSGAASSVAGADGDVQFNSGNTLYAVTNFNYDVANNRLRVGGGTAADDTLEVTGTADISGLLEADRLRAVTGGGAGSVGLSFNSAGTLGVYGSGTNVGLSVGGSSRVLAHSTGASVVGNFNATGTGDIGGTLDVGGNTTITGALDVSGALEVDGDISDSGGAVTVNDDLVVNNSLQVGTSFAADNFEIDTIGSGEGMYQYSSGTGDGLSLNTSGVARMTIDGGGNTKFTNDVGIGLAGDPTTGLDIGGILRLRSDPSAVAGAVCALDGSIAYTSGDELLVCSNVTGNWETIGTSGGGGGGGAGIWERSTGVIRIDPSYFNNADDFVVGSLQLDDEGSGNEDERMFFENATGAFRAGATSGTEWDTRGNYSVAMGLNTQATAANTFAVGNNAQARATDALAIGRDVTVAAGALNSMGIGLGITAGVDPQVTGIESLGIFMQDQSGVTFAANNTMGLFGGKLLIDPNEPATELATSNSLTVDVEGDIGAINFCSEDGTFCFTAEDVSTGATGAPGNDREMIFNSAGALATDTNFVFTSAGRIGLGTNSPLADIHVERSVNEDVAFHLINSDDASANSRSIIIVGTSTVGQDYGYLSHRGSGGVGANRTTLMGADTDGLRIMTSQGPIRFTTVGVERIMLTSSGGLGIGTSNPQTLLDVDGTIKMSYGGEACDVSRQGAIHFDSVGEDFYVCQDGSTWQRIITSGGGGTPSGGSDREVQFNSGGNLEGNPNFVFTSAGNLGIGTAAPAQTLDVAGTVNATGATTLGSSLGVTGQVDFSSGLNVTSATVLSSTLDVTGATTLSSSLDVTGQVDFSSGLNVAQATDLASTLGVTGATTLDGLLTTNADSSLGGLVTFTSSGAALLNVGNTAQRPSVPSNGMIRYNTDNGMFEAYQAGAWQDILTGAAATSLAGLTDTNITSLLDGQFIRYNSAAGEWQNVTVSVSDLAGNAGLDREIFFNSGGALGTDANFVFTSAGRFGLGASAPVDDLTIFDSDGDSISSISLMPTGSDHVNVTLNRGTNSNFARVQFQTAGVSNWALGAPDVDVAWSSSGNEFFIGRTSSVDPAFIIEDGTFNVGIGRNSPQTLLDVDGTIKMSYGGEACDASRQGAIHFDSVGEDFYVCQDGATWQRIITAGSGGAGLPAGGNDREIQFNSGGDLTGDTNFVLTSAGRLGLGIATPTQKLSVRDGNIFVNHTTDAAGLLAWGQGNGTQYSYLQLGENVTGRAWMIDHNDLYQNSLNFSYDGSGYMALSSTGLLGVGTLTPTHNLHVSGDVNANVIGAVTNMNAGASARAQLRLVTDGGQTLISQRSVAGGDLATIYNTNAGGLYVVSEHATSSNLAFQTGAAATNRMVIDHDGLVTFTSSGAVLLPVGNTAQQPSSPQNGMIRYNTDNGMFEAYQAGAWQDILTGAAATSLAGLTDTNITSLLDGQFIRYNSAAGEWRNVTVSVSDLAGNAGLDREIFFNSGGTLGTDTNFVLTSAGNLGIGTASPSTTLDVYGNVPGDGNYIANIRNDGDDGDFLSMINDLGNRVVAFNQGGAGHGNLVLSDGSGTDTITLYGFGATLDLIGTGGELRLADTNSFSDPNDRFDINADIDRLVVEFYDDSASATFDNLVIDADGVIRFASTGASVLNLGTTAQRPTTAENGMIRYNTDNDKFEAYQGGTWQDILTSAVAGGASAPDRGIQFNSGGSFAADANFVYTSTGSLGLGTATPNILGTSTRALTVSALGASETVVLELQGNNAVDSNASAITFFNGAAPIGGIVSRVKGTTSSGALAFSTFYDGTPTEVLRLSEFGAMGVGTIAPQTQLDVDGTLKIAYSGEACDASREGAIRFVSATNSFAFCADNANDWETVSLGAGTLTALSDTNITAPATGQVLYYSGSEWVNNVLAVNDLSDASTSYTSGSMYIGQGAGASIASGNITDNTFIGYNAGNLTNSARQITIVGSGAGSLGGVGNFNTLIGYNAGRDGPGVNNVMIGDSAGLNATGGTNIFIGSSVATRTTSGSQNTIMGYLAGGSGSGSNGTRANSTLIGYRAGQSLMPNADNNTFFGHNSGATATTGSNNLLVGYGVDLPFVTASNYINIGNVLYGSAGTGELFLGSVSTGGAVRLPTGGVATRPGDLAGTTAVNGMIRYNTTSDRFEAYQAGAWQDIITGSVAGGAAAPDRGIQFNSGGSFAADTHLTYTSKGDFIVGSYQLDDTGTGLEDSRMVFYKSAGAFRVGVTQAGGWDEAYVANYSIAMGYNARVEPQGVNSIAIGANSFAWYPDSMALGTNATVDSANSIVIGPGYIDSSSPNSFVIGSGVVETASPNSIVIGKGYVAGQSNIAIGEDVLVTGGYSGAVSLGNQTGNDPILSGGYSFAYFMGNQSGIDVTSANTFGVFGGKMVIDPAVPATNLSADTALEVEGSLKIAYGGEACDASREGAIRFVSATNSFAFCADNANDWETVSLGGGTLTALTDTNIAAPSTGNILYYSGSEWINNALAINDLSDASANYTSGSMYMGQNSGASATAIGNTALGHLAGRDLTNGLNNTFLGNSAGRKTNSGYQNTFVGEGAGDSNEGGNENVFVGQAAGYLNVSGNRNVFVGEDAAENSAGSFNTVIGNEAASSLAAGDSNIIVGYLADVPTANISNYINIGNVFYGSASTGELYIGGTGALRLPTGTVATRPGDLAGTTAVNGMIRYNTTSDKFEAYQGGSWQDILTGAVAGGASAPDRGIQFNSGNSFAAAASFVYTSAGRLGIGDGTPEAGLDIVLNTSIGTNSDYDGKDVRFSIQSLPSTPSAYSGEAIGLRNTMAPSGGGFNFTGELTGIYNETGYGSGLSAAVRTTGVKNIVDGLSSQSVGHVLTGAQHEIRPQGAATVAGLYGVQVEIDSSALTNADDAAGLRVNLTGGPAKVDNWKGLWLEDSGSDANFYAIYSSGGTKSYHQGAFGLGVAAPNAKLDVDGSLKIAYGGEACDAAREGGIHYNSSDDNFYVCQTAGSWTVLATGSPNAAAPDRGIQFNSGNSFAAASTLQYTSMGALNIGSFASASVLDEQNFGINKYGLRIVGQDTSTVPSDMLLSTYSNTAAAKSDLDFFRARGTEAVPADVQVGDELGLMRWYGFRNGNYRNGGSIVGVVSNLGGSVMQADISMRAGSSEVMRVVRTGRVGIMTSTPALTLDVNGAIKFASSNGSACDATTEGAMQYGSGGVKTFEVCADAASGWEQLALGGTVSGALNDLSDVNTAGFANGNVLLYSAGASAWVPGDAPLVGAFTDLTDTPANYTGQGGRFAVVNAGETAIAFTDTVIESVTGANAPVTFDLNDLGDVTVSGATGGQYLTYDSASGEWIAGNIGTAGGLWTAGSGDDIYYNSGSPRVGIGDTSPDAELDIESTSPAVHLTDSDAASDGNTSAKISFRNSINQEHGSLGYSNQRNLVLDNDIAGGDLRISTHEDILFYTSSAGSSQERMRIDEFGNVGIGTVTPVSVFDVAGDIKFASSSLACNVAAHEGAMQFGSGGSNIFEVCANSATGWEQLALGGTVSGGLNDLSDVTITAAADGQFLSYNSGAWVNVASPSLWTDSGAGYIEYSSTLGGVKIASITGAAAPVGATKSVVLSANDVGAAGVGRELQFNSGGNLGADANFVYTATGLFGLGTASPVAKLDVLGDIKFASSSLACNAAGHEGAMQFGSGGSNIFEVCANSGTGWEQLALGGTVSGGFTDLSDTPASYVGQAGRFAVVNSGETAIAFTDQIIESVSGEPAPNRLNLSDLGDVSVAGVLDTQFLTYDSATGNWVAGSISTSDVSAYGANNEIQYNSNGSFYSDSTFVYSGGRLGVGNASPSVEVDVTGDIKLSGALQLGQFAGNAPTYISAGYFALNNLTDVNTTGFVDGNVLLYSAGAGNWVAGGVTTGSLSAAGADTQLQYNSGGEFAANANLVFTAAGNLGVGTAAPSVELDVVGDIRTSNNLILAPVSGLSAPVYMSAGYFAVGSLTDVDVTGVADGNVLLYSAGAAGWVVGTSGGGGGGGAIDDLSDATTDYTTDYNFFMGSGAGASIASGGQNNLAIGQGALPAVTTGDANFAIGRNTLTAITNPSGNIAIGNNAGRLYTMTEFALPSVFIGNNAGEQTGYWANASMVAIGSNALAFSGGTFPVGGSTVIGTAAMENAGQNGPAEDNTVIGNGAGIYQREGNDNVYIGAGAASGGNTYNHTGDNNVFIGKDSANSLDGANNNNIFLGQGTGLTLNAGDSNLLIGTGIDVPTATTSNYMSIADVIYASNLYTATPRVGINTNNPTANLEVYGDFAAPETWSIALNVTDGAYGASAAYNGTVGVYSFVENAAVGAGYTEAYSIFAEAQGTSDAKQQNVFGVGASVITHDTDVGHAINISDGNVSTGGTIYGLYINLDDTDVTRYGIYQTTANNNYLAGNLGIGEPSPSVALDVVGDIEYTGTLTDVSDRRLKTDITPLNTDEMMAKIAQINTYSFRMKDDPKGVLEFGVMAQELEKQFPELVKTANDEMGTKSVNYVGLIAPLIEASKELKSENDNLRAELAAMKTAQAQFETDIMQQVNGLKAHTGYGISKAQMGLWMLVIMFGSLSLWFVIGGMVRNRQSKSS